MSQVAFFFSLFKGDSLNHLHQNNNGMMFTTYDRDQDVYWANCAEMWKGAWWYHSCHEANLNGLYLGGPVQEYAKGITWNGWHGQKYSLKATKLMLRCK